MRKFNKTEKDFIKLLDKISDESLEFFSYYLQKYYFSNTSNSALFLFTQQKKALLFIKKDVFDNMSLRKKEMRNFLEILSLVNYLKQEHLINIIPNPQINNSTLLVMREEFNSINQITLNSNLQLNQHGGHLKFTDFSKIYDSQDNILFEAVNLEEHVYNIIMDLFTGLLFVTEELKVLVKNNFKSSEDIRYRNNQIATWTSIIMAFLFGLYGIFRDLSHKNNSKIPHQETKEIKSENINININTNTKHPTINYKTDSIK